jgi:uncharacterized membrane protein
LGLATLVWLMLLGASAGAASVATTPVSDGFNRADGGLGSNWTDIVDGGLSISGQTVVSTNDGYSGEMRSGGSFDSDQFSQIELTSTQLAAGQLIGPAVRMQDGGRDGYFGIYFWNNGYPQLRLYKRSAGTWIQLGNSYTTQPLPAGTTLTLSAVGSTIIFREDGTKRIWVTDAGLSGGAPGIIAYGTATADNWTGGTAWTDIVDGGLLISGQTVVGARGGYSGEMLFGQSFDSDQFSQIELTSTQFTGGQWIGPAVRMQHGGRAAYLGIYFWKNGNPQLRLYKRSAGNWTQLGDSDITHPLPAGTTLALTAVGSTITLLVDGTRRIRVTDTSLSGGAPGIIAYGTATADNWTSGTGAPRARARPGAIS